MLFVPNLYTSGETRRPLGSPPRTIPLNVRPSVLHFLSFVLKLPITLLHRILIETILIAPGLSLLGPCQKIREQIHSLSLARLSQGSREVPSHMWLCQHAVESLVSSQTKAQRGQEAVG